MNALKKRLLIHTLAALTLILAWPMAAAARDVWSETGSMTTARTGHAAALVPGDRVFVAGGLSPTEGITASTELFDSFRGQWKSVGPLGTGRWTHTATPLLDGRVLIAGGTAPAGTLFSAEIYTTFTDTCSYTGSMTYARRNHTATLLADGRVLVAGGIYIDGNPLNNAEIYDPGTGGWSRGGNLGTARSMHTGTLLANGRVLVAGGENSAAPSLGDAEIYSGATNTWTNTSSMANERKNHTATLLADGRVLVAGGFDDTWPFILTSTEIYDPATGNWSSTGSMNYARYSHTATLLQDGRVLVMGGVGADGETRTNETEIYDPSKGTWKSVSVPNQARSDHTATLLDDGRVVVAGGSGVAETLSSVFIFDPLGYVTNGSFQTATVDPGDSFSRLAGGSTAIYRWNVGDGGIDYRGDWQAAEADLCVDLNSTSAGSIAQVITISPAGQYRLTFSMAGHPLGLPAVKALRVSAGGQYQDFTFDTTGKDIGNMGWTTTTWFFTADAGPAVLKFQSSTIGSYGPAIDNVRLVHAVHYVIPSGVCGAMKPCYGTIQEAIDAAGDEYIVKVQQGTYNESPTKSTTGTVTISGGWNTTFASQTGTTEIHAPSVTGAGTLKLLPTIRVVPR